MRAIHSLLISSVLLAGCGSGGNSGDNNTADPSRVPISKLGLKNFAASCSDFLDYAADALTEQYLTRYRCFADGPCPVFATGAPESSPTAAPAADSAGGAASSPDRVSSTNTQEAGVDEADIVKADAAGNLYILSGRRLNVFQAFPPQGMALRPVNSLVLAAENEGFYANDFFLDEANDRAVVLASSYDNEGGQSVSIVIDVSNPAAPREISRLGVTGFGLEARRVGNRVHRVSRFDVPTPSWFYEGEDELNEQRETYFAAQDRGDETGAAQIKAQIRNEIDSRLTAAGPGPLLPRISSQPAGGSVTESTLACEAIAHPEVTTGMGLALVDSFNTDGGARGTSGVINNAWIIYGSTNNLYLAQSSFGWFFAPNQAEETAIYRMALSATGAVSFQGVGKVDGSLIGSYAMSEFGGALRVASTSFDANNGDTASHVTVLKADVAGNLPQIGSLRNLAPGERIQGVRYVGERGYVVTFRQVDPLFALDLSDPTAPRVTDELKIPGFSSYMMPLGENFLLTIGRDGDEQQLNGQVAVQLFNVNDPTAITQTAKITPSTQNSGYSYSTAEYDPHAFSYFPDAENAPVPGTLSVPLQDYNNSTGEGFSGFLVVRVDPSAASPLTEIGRVSHDDFNVPANSGCGSGGFSGGGGIADAGVTSSDAAISKPCGGAAYADPRRSVFMEDSLGEIHLYTISNLGIIASDADQPATERGRKELPYDGDQYYCCYAF